MKKSKSISIQNEKAFTLIEIVLAIVILGIIVAIAVPIWQGFISSKNLDAAIRQVASDIREAQARAMAEETYYKVYFDENENCYFVYHRDTTDTPWNNPLPWGVHNEATITLPSGIEYEEVTFSDNDVQFQPSGYLYFGNNGSVYLRNDKGKIRHLTVVSTGKVNIKP